MNIYLNWIVLSTGMSWDISEIASLAADLKTSQTSIIVL